MSDINKEVAAIIVKQLKEKHLISDEEKNIEIQIANGTIKENEWKLILERQIKNLENLTESEIK